MADVPLILVVGGDALAVRVCEELCSTQGHRVALVWPHDHELAKQLERIHCEYLPFSPNDFDSLRQVGVLDATSLMALDEDDRVNLQVALKARDINPKIRIVLRQFNRTLAQKIEQNLPNCSVLSLASHSAATIVGAALDSSCFYALQFPDITGVLCGFSQRLAGLFGIVGMNQAEAQTHLKVRVIAIDGVTEFDPARRFEAGDMVVVFGQLKFLIATVVDPVTSDIIETPNLPRRIRSAIDAFRHLDPVIRGMGIAAVLVFIVATMFFGMLFQKRPDHRGLFRRHDDDHDRLRRYQPDHASRPDRHDLTRSAGRRVHRDLGRIRDHGPSRARSSPHCRACGRFAPIATSSSAARATWVRA